MSAVIEDEPAVEAPRPRDADQSAITPSNYLLTRYEAINNQHGGIADYRR